MLSQVMDQWAPAFPPSPPAKFTPNEEDLRTLIDAFHKAVEAAKVFDAVTGQPDCVDPEKGRLEARVAELERRLDAMVEAAQGE
jgi:hypothetical protein